MIDQAFAPGERAAETPTMIDTPFGPFTADESSIVGFPEGLPGFEECRRFVVLAASHLEPLQCLHAVDGPPASFLAIDPRRALGRYRCALTARDAGRLQVADPADLLWLALLAVDGDRITANLRAPVVINPARMVGYQVIPVNTLYPLKHPLDLG